VNRSAYFQGKSRQREKSRDLASSSWSVEEEKREGYRREKGSRFQLKIEVKLLLYS
jgi:hypothetical protein